MNAPVESVIETSPFVLVVEDSNEDFETFQRLLTKISWCIPIHRCHNGDRALEFLRQAEGDTVPDNGFHPSMIVLDLNLPGTDGREVLRQIKQNNQWKTIPVVVFTTSNNPKDIDICYEYGVDKYIVKSIDFSQLKQNIQEFADYWLEVTKRSFS